LRETNSINGREQKFMKYNPNNNLLILVNLQNQDHFNLFVIHYYLHAFILHIRNKNHNLTKRSSTPDRLSALVEGELEEVPPAPSSRLRSFVAMVLGANAPRITEISSSHNSERRDCLNHGFGRPDVASDREEGRHGAYIGPIQEDGKLFIKRKTGNKVEMNIEYDSLRRRPKSLTTVLAEGQTEQNVSYTYDKKGNINSITDKLNESRSQTFEYDALNRVTKAIGKYGTEDYAYHSNGNLLQRGEFNLQYSNPNHVHAVTKVSSLQTGDTNYTYDTTGNLIERNGDVFRYNSQNKLAEITTAGGDVFQYSYDASWQQNQETTEECKHNHLQLQQSLRNPQKPWRTRETHYVHSWYRRRYGSPVHSQ
jgi:hypothetical protein